MWVFSRFILFNEHFSHSRLIRYDHMHQPLPRLPLLSAERPWGFMKFPQFLLTFDSVDPKLRELVHENNMSRRAQASEYASAPE
jgi:hypothetical protein